MTTEILLPMTIQMYAWTYSEYDYEKWCLENIPKSDWVMCYKHSGNTKYSQRKIIFLNNEDALAFRLRFGL